MVMIRGFIEILQLADGNEPKYFNDFTKISIKRKKLSSATVSRRIDELLGIKVIEEVISRSKSRRRIIAYRATSNGKKVIKLANELETALTLP